MISEEMWVDIAGWEGIYQVSDLGRVKALARAVVRTKPYPSVLRLEESIKSLARNGNGYLFVFLKRDGTRQKMFIHRLVAQAFLENPHNKPIVNHKDSDRGNNLLSNLEWVTDSENTKHAYANGRHPRREPKSVTNLIPAPAF